MNSWRYTRSQSLQQGTNQTLPVGLAPSTVAKAGRLPNNLLAEKRNAARSEMTSQFRAHPKFQKVIPAIMSRSAKRNFLKPEKIDPKTNIRFIRELWRAELNSLPSPL